MRVFKFLSLCVCFLVPVTVAAEQVPPVAYNPSPLGIYNQLKIRDTATFRSALETEDLRLGKVNATTGDQNRVVIATQRKDTGDIVLSDVKIKGFTYDADHPNAKLNFPQAELKANEVFVYNGGTFDADAGYSRSDNESAQIGVMNADTQIPTYANVAFWSSNNRWDPAAGRVGTYDPSSVTKYDTKNVDAGHVILDGIEVPQLPCDASNFLQRGGYVLLKCLP